MGTTKEAKAHMCVRKKMKMETGNRRRCAHVSLYRDNGASDGGPEEEHDHGSRALDLYPTALDPPAAHVGNEAR